MQPGTRRNLSFVTKIALLSVLSFSSLIGTASAATTIGSLFEGDPAVNSAGIRFVPVRNADGSEYAGSPMAGVLTSVTVETSGSAGTLKIPVMRPAGPLGPSVDYLITDSSIEVPVTVDASPSGHLTTVGTRVSIAAGDRLGLDYADGSMYATQQLTGSSQNCGWLSLSPPQAVGEVVSYNAANCNSWWPSVQGSVEADADGDGFGDETQDLCPSDASRQSACLVPPPLAPPNLVVSAVKSKARPGSTATRSFKVTNVGGSIAAPVTIKVVSSKTVKRIKFTKSLLSLLPGGSIALKVKVTPKTAASTRLTLSVSTPGETATADNSAAAKVKFKLSK